MRDGPERRHTREIDVQVLVRDEASGIEDVEPDRLLDGVPLDVQEAWVCEDFMFVLQGVEGSLIRYAEGYDPLDADQRLRGARWRVDPSLGELCIGLADTRYITAVTSEPVVTTRDILHLC